MKTKSEIEDRIRAMLVGELERRVQKAIERLPHRCTHNYRQPLDTRKTVEGETNPTFNRITMGVGPEGVHLPVFQTIGLCLVGVEDIEQADLTICEDPIDAQRCPIFVPRKTKEDLWAEFSNETTSPAWLEANMPELYGLTWALQTCAVKVPWWTRLFFWIRRVRPEPVRPQADLMKLLPPPLS